MSQKRFCSGECRRLLDVNVEDLVVIGGHVYCVGCAAGAEAELAHEDEIDERERALESALDPDSYRGPDGELGGAWDFVERRAV